ncbi:hypothetical protein RQP46_003127 [Phenoliferia psychrophenolica]
MDLEDLPQYRPREDQPAPYSQFATTASSADDVDGPTVFSLAHGEIALDAPGDSRHIQVITLSGIIEYTEPQFSQYSQERRAPIGFSRLIYHEELNLCPSKIESSVKFFQLSLPGMIKSVRCPGIMLALPPSVQIGGFGVRYFIKVSTTSVGRLRREFLRFIPVVFLPLQPPPLLSPRRLVALSAGAKVPGPSRDATGWHYHPKIQTLVKGESVDLSLWVSSPRAVARGETVEWLLVVTSPSATTPVLTPHTLEVDLVARNPWARTRTYLQLHTNAPGGTSYAPTTESPLEAGSDPPRAVALRGLKHLSVLMPDMFEDPIGGVQLLPVRLISLALCLGSDNVSESPIYSSFHLVAAHLRTLIINLVSTYNAFEGHLDLFSGCTSLEHIEFRWTCGFNTETRISPLHLEAVLDALPPTPTLRHLSLDLVKPLDLVPIAPLSEHPALAILSNIPFPKMRVRKWDVVHGVEQVVEDALLSMKETCERRGIECKGEEKRNMWERDS